MSEYVTLKKEDLLDAYKEGLEEERELLELLYPEHLPPKPSEIDISTGITWKMVPGGTEGGCFLEGYYKGKKIAYVNPTDKYDKPGGVRITFGKTEKYKMQWCAGHTFKIIKIG